MFAWNTRESRQDRGGHDEEDCEAEYEIRNVGGIKIDGKKVMGWVYRKMWDGMEPPMPLQEKEREVIWEESLDNGIENVRGEWHVSIGENMDAVKFLNFPPMRYLKKYGIARGDERHVFPGGQKEGPWVDIITPLRWGCYPSGKRYIAPDFGTYEYYFTTYFNTEDDNLARAMDGFLHDLMRDIVQATEPEYAAYFDIDEYKPLEEDPICENGKFKVYYMKQYGNVHLGCPAGPLFYWGERVIFANGGEQLIKYLETLKGQGKIEHMEKIHKGVFVKTGDITTHSYGQNNTYISLTDFLLTENKKEMLKRRHSHVEEDVRVEICDY